MSKTYIGGQAVLEGVMMRSPKSFVVAVRRPDGSIAVREEAWTTLGSGWKVLRWPLFRGVVVLLESMHNGFSALKFSAEQAQPPEDASSAPDSKMSEVTSLAMMAVAAVMAVALFNAAPHLLTFGLGRVAHLPLASRSFLFQLVDGCFRVAILLGYIGAISRTRDAKRLFQYHGAEHKAIWAYESGRPLTVENAAKFSTLHPRCGTSFLFVVVMVAVLLHVALIPLVPTLHPNGIVNQLLLILIKVPLMLPIAGLAYELQKLSARDHCPRVLQWLMRPGMWMQRITTQEPSSDQLEIALVALERALAREEGRSRVEDGVRVYPDFGLALAA